MADKHDNHGEWMKFARCCMSDADWEVAANRPEAILSHRSCPWGGHLIKIESTNLFIQNAPEDPRDLFVRPEVRAMSKGPMEMKLRCLETYAPGDALMERTNCMWIIRLAAVLFGHGHGLWQDHFFQKVPTVSRHRLHKDFPEVGDCAYFAVEGIWIARPVKEILQRRYRVVLVFSTPEDIWASWASPFFPTFTDMFHRAMERVLNGPGFGDMREVDKKFYIVLSMRSFNRGHPMLPQTHPSDDAVSISAGQHHGFNFWIRFHSGKFYLDEYLQRFLELLGYKLKIYRAMDGRELVPYQCVVVRQEWDHLRESFFAAFRVQKSAYRRANGGTSSPTLVEDAEPRWTGRIREVSHDIKTMVRKTFLECHEGPGQEGVKRSNSTGRMMNSA